MNISNHRLLPLYYKKKKRKNRTIDDATSPEFLARSQ